MVAFLSSAWLDQLATLGAELPERPDASARVQQVVTGAPDGEVRYHQAVVDGRIVAVSPGDDPDAEITFTQPYSVARLIADGELDAGAAFMQGQVKVLGDMAKMLALMPLTRSEEWRSALAQLAGRTTY